MSNTSTSRHRLLELRPSIPHIDTAADSGPVESFQNDTLRPVLKFQNEILLAFVRRYIEVRKPDFGELPAARQESFVRDSLRKDQHLRNFLVGAIAGQFTLEEYGFFILHERELRKRCLDMLLERVLDQLGLKA